MMKNRLIEMLKDLWKDGRGASYLFVAAVVIPLMGLIGVATDAARGYVVKARLSQALDAAGLAGGQVVQDADLLAADIAKYFGTNFPPSFMGATIYGPTYTVDAAQEVITVTATATVQTTFMRLFGFQDMTVSASTEVTRKTNLLDVVMAIDMSGSMSWNDDGGTPRIQAARGAATALIDILFGNNATKDMLKIGLVPWNAKVNVTTNGAAFDPGGTTIAAVEEFTRPYTGAPQTQVYFASNSVVALLDPPPGDWQGCVYSRFVDDDDPATNADTLLGLVPGPVVDWMAWEPVGPEGEPVPGSARCANAPWGADCTTCLSHGITPLTNTKATIQDAVNELTTPEGSTNIVQGLGWAWRVLTPGAPFAEADPDPDGERVQAIVLLTDGENWGYYGDGYNRTPAPLFGIGPGAGPAGMDDRLRELATNIRAAGVVLYTIQFANQGGALQALMREIASEPDPPYYNYAPDAAALAQVFTEIANNLSELRLSK